MSDDRAVREARAKEHRDARLKNLQEIWVRNQMLVHGPEAGLKSDCGCHGTADACACDSKADPVPGDTDPATEVACTTDLPGWIDSGQEARAWIRTLEAKDSLNAEEKQLLIDAKDVAESFTGCPTPESELLMKRQYLRALTRASGGPYGEDSPMVAGLMANRPNFAKATKAAKVDGRLREKWLEIRGRSTIIQRKLDLLTPVILEKALRRDLKADDQRRAAEAAAQAELEDINLRLEVAAQ